MTLEFEIKPIVLIDYLVTKLPDVDNEALAHQVEVYKDIKLSDNENAGRYEDNDLPNSKPINDFKEILVNALSFVTNQKVKIDNIWGHVTVPQAATEYHHHVGLHNNNGRLSDKDSPFSCVYYCKIPENSGDIRFRMMAGFREYIVTEKAEVGKLIVFPSEVPHMTGKNASNENRVSISANFRII